jgi:hypothetical protein
LVLRKDSYDGDNAFICRSKTERNLQNLSTSPSKNTSLTNRAVTDKKNYKDNLPQLIIKENEASRKSLRKSYSKDKHSINSQRKSINQRNNRKR